LNTNLQDGSVNPNVGRPYVGNSGQYGNTENYIDRDSYRFTAFGEFRSEDVFGKSWLASLLGRHVFTGLAAKDTKNTDFRTFSRWASDPSYASSLGGLTDITNGFRQIDWISYLGGSLLNASSAHGAGLSNISATIDPSGAETVRYFDSHWKATGVNPGDPYTYITYDSSGHAVSNSGTQADNPANYVGWQTKSFNIMNAANPSDLSQLYTSGTKARTIVKSSGLTWQAYFADGDIVPTFGWRRDQVSSANATAPKTTDGTNVSLMNYNLDSAKVNTASQDTKSWGIVGHLPKKWADQLPLGSNISVFFNHGENFKADAPRGDVFGNQIPNQTGTTKDMGIAITTLNDRLSFKVTHYETKEQNASLGADSAGFSSSLYYIWALPYWGATHALAALDGISNPQRNQGSWGWPWNNIDGGDPVKIRAAVSDFFQHFPLDQHFADEWGLGLNVAKMHSTNEADWYASVPQYAGAANLGLQPAYGGNLKDFGNGPQASVDTMSKGYEFEVTGKITKNWDVTLNASETISARTGISPAIASWIATYTKFLAGPAGDITLWGGDPFRTAWANNILAPYSVLTAQIGQSAPEIPKWRYNLVTTYSFDHGTAKGLYVGGGYRWEDRRILGYQYNSTSGTLDVTKPWYGPTDAHVDLWSGYTFNLDKKLSWRMQLNLRNVGEKAHLVPATMQPDGTVALSRIAEGMTWQFTNTFSF
ncbi:MAG: hypothetical protein ACHQ5A_09190, partial [Opitutales bacterium]